VERSKFVKNKMNCQTL